MLEQEKTYSQMKNEFYEKYQKQIVPCVRQYENERKQKLFILKIIVGILFVFCLFDSLLSLVVSSSSSVMTFCIDTFGCCVLLYFVWVFIKKGFENKIKAKIMPIVCSCFENLTWAEGKNINSSWFIDSGVVPKFTSENYDDTFNGSHKGVSLKIVEADLKIGSGKNRVPVFKGAIVILDMNKKFSGHTVIVPATVPLTTPSEILRHTTLEDVTFEKKFDVFTNDEVESRYLITPSFMERLNDIKTAFNATIVRCAFYQNYLLVALLTNKDLFSLCSLVAPLDDSKQYFQMFEEILSIIKLIDHFKLDQKLGL